jgi:polyhydroxybutyrate depolymerase
VILFPLAIACSSSGDCGDETVCEVRQGYYMAAPPQDWDGQTELPVVIEFHGYNGTPEKIYGRDDHRNGWSDSGVLWVQPAGSGGSWNVFGPHLLGRDEVAFTHRVLDDVRARWPIDETRLYLVGFSIGVAVAFDTACQDSSPWAGIFSLSGGYFQPLPKDCEGPPIPVMHLHGTADETWPIEGSSLGPFLGQGSMSDNLDLWRDHNSCDLPVPSPDPLFECEVQACAEGAGVRACLHPRGHTRPTGWNTQGFAWLVEQAGR